MKRLTIGTTGLKHKSALPQDPTGASVDESTKNTVIKLCNGCRAYDMEDCGLLDCYCQKSGSCDAAGPLLDMVDPWCRAHLIKMLRVVVAILQN